MVVVFDIDDVGKNYMVAVGMMADVIDDMIVLEKLNNSKCCS